MNLVALVALMGRCRPAVLRAAGLVTVLALSLALAPGGSAASPAPAAPSPAPPTTAPALVPPLVPGASVLAIGRAAQAADGRVRALTARLAAQARAVAGLSAAATAAEQGYTVQQGVQAQAQAAAALAHLRVSAARVQYRLAYQAFQISAESAYESDGAPGSISTSSVGSLLVVDDPGAVLSAGTDRQLLAAHQAAVVSQLKLAIRGISVAERTEQGALAAATAQTAKLAAALRTAELAATAARAALAGLRTDLAAAKATQVQADAALSAFLGGWSIADPGRAGALNAVYQQIAARARHEVPAPAGPHWTAAMGRTATERALSYLTTPYAWAGGSATGPTLGECVQGSARNDCHITGFDCSGLALFAWAPYLTMAHSAASQYGAGSMHPALTGLLPGDLVFWSSNGAVSGIHHVAIYVGAGNVIQAPESGDIVRITPLGAVSAGYFGATRPLT